MLRFQAFWLELSTPLPSHPVEPICAGQPLSSSCAWPFVLLRAAHMYRLALLPVCPPLRLTASDGQARRPNCPHFWELLCHYCAVTLQKTITQWCSFFKKKIIIIKCSTLQNLGVWESNSNTGRCGGSHPSFRGNRRTYSSGRHVRSAVKDVCAAR